MRAKESHPTPRDRYGRFRVLPEVPSPYPGRGSRVSIVSAALACIAIACSQPTRLEDPPEPTPYCIPEGDVCEFDHQCCTELCFSSQCVDRNDLVFPDAGCVPDQVDIAIVVDLSGSMQRHIASALDALDGGLSGIPPTTTVQVWATPDTRTPEDLGAYYRVMGRGTPEEAREAIRSLYASPRHGLEGTVDVTLELLRSNDPWRFGTTVRALIMVSDEWPHSYTTPKGQRADVCAALLPSDRPIAFTTERDHWEDTCFTAYSLSALWSLPDLLADPCLSPDV